MTISSNCQHGESSIKNLIPPIAKIDTTNIEYPKNLPTEIWLRIFSYLPSGSLKKFHDSNEKINENQEDSEYNNLLKIDKLLIVSKNDFSKVVNNVYEVALCCKAFYALTQRERNLLIGASKYYNEIKKTSLFFNSQLDNRIIMCPPPPRPFPDFEKDNIEIKKQKNQFQIDKIMELTMNSNLKENNIIKSFLVDKDYMEVKLDINKITSELKIEDLISTPKWSCSIQ